jgi:hypothetical protein
MSKVEKYALANSDRILANMRAIQKKMYESNECSSRSCGSAIDDSSEEQQKSKIKSYLVKKYLGWSAWSR